MLPSPPVLLTPGGAPFQVDAECRIALKAWTRERCASLAVSVAIHTLLLAAAIIVFPAPRTLRAPPPESLSVEMITPGQLATLARPRRRAAPRPSAGAAGPPARNPPVPSPALAVPVPLPPRKLVLTHARTILSGGALDRVASASLRTLADDARFEQLCGIEAMEQIARGKGGFNPERTIAYATADTRLEGDTLAADGAAFLSGGHWYRLAFRCRGTPDRRQVLSFDFATGEQFPDDDPALPAGASD
jgi:hypothetical protein